MTIYADATTAVTVNAGALLANVKHALNAVSKRPVAPVLAGVIVECADGVLEVSAFDYELSVRKRLSTDGSIPRSLVVAAALRDALARLDGKAPVTMFRDGDTLVLTQARKRVALPILEGIDDYPSLPELSGDAEFAILAERLADLASYTNPFRGKDDTLPVITGHNLSYSDGLLTVGTTDRFRAALMTSVVSPEPDAPDRENVLHNFATFAGVFEAGETVRVHLGERGGTAWFASESATVTMRAHFGEFPSIARLFPGEPTTEASFDATAFLAAHKFVAAGVARGTAMTVEVGAGEVTLANRPGDSAEAAMEDVVAADTSGDVPFTAGFEPSFLADAVKVWGKGARVQMSSTSPNKPLVFTSETVPNLRVLQMPRRLLS